MTDIEKSESILSTFFCESSSEAELERRARYLIYCLETYDDVSWQYWEDNEAS